MLIAQISDTHIGLKDKSTWTAQEAEDRLAETVDQLNASTPRLDAVIVTGDLVDTGTDEEYARLRPLLDQLVPPCFLLAGNHDDRAALRSAFRHHDYLPEESEFLHYSLEDFPVRIICLDTHIPNAPHGELCRERLSWLEDRLSERPDTPTIIFMHHPPFASGITLMDKIGCHGADELETVLRRHDNIERVACGHVHRGMQRRWAGTVGCIAPSTVAQIDLCFPGVPDMAFIHEPRGYLLHHWAEDSGLTTHIRAVGAHKRVPISL